jgi:hypothetical protein
MKATITDTRTRTRGLRLVGTLAAVAAAAGTLVVTATTAEAVARSCSTRGTYNAPIFGNRPLRWCDNRYWAPVYSLPELSYPHGTGHMKTTRSWFICQDFYGDNPETRNSNGKVNANNWWLYTKADTVVEGSSKWGWMPATYVLQGANDMPVPGIPYCFSSP